MEYASNGDFFNLIINKRIVLTEILARTYFHQLIDAIEYLHSNGVAHLDLKLSNLLLGEDFRLKLVDFDLAYKTGDLFILSKGSKFYRSSEIIAGYCEDPLKADIFSAGIILFVFKAKGILPHYEGDLCRGHDLYGMLRNDIEGFWKMHTMIQKSDEEFFDKDFKELFEGMVKSKPSERFSISKIKESSWFNGPIYNDEELKVKMIQKN